MAPLPDPQDADVHSVDDMLQLQSLVIKSGVHEIRGLLLAGGYAKLLLREVDGPLTAAHRQYLITIVDNTQHIKQILASMSRVMDSAAELNFARFMLHDLLLEILLYSEHELRRKWEWKGDPCRICIAADRTKLRAAILGILQAGCWYGYGSIEVHEEKQRAIIAIRGPILWSVTSVASEVQEDVHEPRLVREDNEVLADIFETSRDMLHLHGGLLYTRPYGDQSYEAIVVLPVLSGGEPKKEVRNA